MVVKSYENTGKAKEMREQQVKGNMDTIFAKSFTRFGFVKFVMPSIVTMLFISLYTIIDGIFVSNYVGSNALAAVNIVYPFLNVIFSIGIMMAVGGTAVIAIRLGEKEKDRADKTLTMIAFIGVLIGVIISIFGFRFIDNIVLFLGAEPEIFQYCKDYAFYLMGFMPLVILKIMFEYFIRADGRADYSLYISVTGGVVNIILDYVFIALFGWGIMGAAIATGLGFTVSLILSIMYFLSKKSNLKFKKAKFKFNVLSNVVLNGSAHMISEISLGLITFAFNGVALKYAGADGVAALTIIMYAEFLLIAIFLGFANGVSPVISYNYGAKLQANLKRLVKYSIEIVVVASLVVFVIAEFAAPLICRAFVEPDTNVYAIAVPGLRLFALAYCFFGINLLVPAIFASLNNGKIATIIAASRGLVFVFVGLYLLTPILKLNGVWLAIPFSEAITLLISILLLRHYRSKYHYY